MLDTVKTPSGLFVHHLEVMDGILTIDVAVRLEIDVRAGRGFAPIIRRHICCMKHCAMFLATTWRRKDRWFRPIDCALTSRIQKPLARRIGPVQNIVNERIRMNSDVSTRIMTPDAAIKLGALALFGEKYGEEVRVVQMGGLAEMVVIKPGRLNYAAARHVIRTGDIALLKIVSESAVAGGVRRIEAVTQSGALEWIETRDQILSKAADLLKIHLISLLTVSHNCWKNAKKVNVICHNCAENWPLEQGRLPLGMKLMGCNLLDVSLKTPQHAN